MNQNVHIKTTRHKPPVWVAHNVHCLRAVCTLTCLTTSEGPIIQLSGTPFTQDMQSCRSFQGSEGEVPSLPTRGEVVHLLAVVLESTLRSCLSEGGVRHISPGGCTCKCTLSKVGFIPLATTKQQHNIYTFRRLVRTPSTFKWSRGRPHCPPLSA